MPAVTAIDLYAGAGGATRGLRDAGIDVVAAIENYPDAASSYRLNHPEVMLVERDIRRVDPEGLRRRLGLRRGSLGLLKACPPCQGFSSLAKGQVDEDRNDLVLDVARFAIAFRPRSILLENVPGLRHDDRLGTLTRILEAHGYRFRQYVVDAQSLGVPQRRKRLIVIGLSSSVRRALPDSIEEMLPGSFDTTPRTVRDVFAALAESVAVDDPLNRARKSAPAVFNRIRAIPVGGTRFDLPEQHQLACHRSLDRRDATSAYGRLRMDAPAPTLTTRCTTPACGSFVHPTEDRGITLREAAALQTFPTTYAFQGRYGSIEKQIGNAVPVRMAEALGLVLVRLVRGTIS
jgi:DNA (cytosine-5)-methyltransferase 1